MILKEESYLITTKIEVGQFFGGAPEDGFIELREPDNKSFFDIRKAQKESDEELHNKFCEILPQIIVDHSLFRVEDQKMKPEEVAALVKERPLLYLTMVNQYSSEVLFTQGKGKREK